MVPWGNGGGRAEGVEERRGWKRGGGGRGEGVKFSFLGSGWRAPPSSRLARRRRGIGLCHTLIRVNTI